MNHKTEEISLANGAKGLLIDIPGTQIIEFRLIFRAGDYCAPAKKEQLAHLTEHFLVAGANELYPVSKEFRAAIGQNDARYGGCTDNLHVIYSSSCAIFEWERVLKLMLAAIVKPLFPEDAFANEVQIVREELQKQQEHETTLYHALNPAVGFIGHTNKQGSASLKNINLDDVKQFYQNTYFSGNLSFIIAGDLTDKKQALAALLQAEGPAPLGDNKLLDLPAEQLKGLDKPLLIDSQEAQNLHFAFYSLSRHKFTADERLVLSVLENVLVNDFGSRIFGKAVEEGLLYDPGSIYFGNSESSSYWSFDNQLSPDGAEALFGLIRRELDDVLGGGLTGDEVEAAKKMQIGSHFFIQTPSDAVHFYLESYIYYDHIPNYQAVPEKIKAVDVKAVTAVARKVFAENQYALGLLGPSVEKLSAKLHQIIAAIGN